MKTLHTLNCVALACLAIGTPALAQAQDAYTYMGLGLGQSRAQLDEARIAAEQISPAGLALSNLNTDDSSRAYKLFLGYQFNPYFGTELGYFKLGSYTMGATSNPAGAFQGRITVQGYKLDLVGTLPITERFAATARIGAQFARTRDEFSGSGAASVLDTSPSHRATNAKVGLGLQYELTPNFLLRSDIERFRVSDAVGHDAKINMLTVSLVIPLGRPAATAARMAQTPSYTAPVPTVAPMPMATPMAMVAPVPAPAPVAAAVPAPPRRVSFSAESLFGFDQSALRSEGKTALDTFAQQTQGAQYSSIQVEGHTDRLGSAAYNQKLSLRRAESVKAYLVASDGLDASKISTVGKGETQPRTSAADCARVKRGAALMACLQPDRRVEIEVVGTR